MLRRLVQHFHNAINRVTKFVLANVIYVVAALGRVFGHLARGQATERSYEFVELRPLVLRNVSSDPLGLLAERMNSVVKVAPQISERFTFNPRTKATHKTSEVSFAFLSCILQCVFSESPIMSIGKPPIGEPTNRSRDHSPNDARDKKFRRVKFDLGHLLLGFAVIGVISLLAGMGAYSAYAFVKIIPKRQQHPLILYDIYCLMLSRWSQRRPRWRHFPPSPLARKYRGAVRPKGGKLSDPAEIEGLQLTAQSSARQKTPFSYLRRG